jgi:hypothetical protein
MMRTVYKSPWMVIAILGALMIVFGATDSHAAPSREAPLDVVKAYLRATRARDFETSYRYISTRDRSVRDKNTYLRSQDNFTGFALELAKLFATETEVWVIGQKLGSKKARFEVGYRAPTADEISVQLLDWNPGKLNALSPIQQAALVESFEKLKRSAKMIFIEGRETFDLVSEKDGWKISLDWPSQHRVLFKTSPLRSAEIAVKFLRNDLLVKSGEPFQVDFKITNRTNREIVVQLNHLFEPRQIEKNIDMIACGSLVPFSLRPRETQELSSAYLFRGNLPAKAPVEIIYDFKLLPAGGKQRLSQMIFIAGE